MTAFGSPELRRAAAQTGAFRFVEKPLDLEELRQIIHQARPGERGWTGLVGGLNLNSELARNSTQEVNSILSRVSARKFDELGPVESRGVSGVLATPIASPTNQA